MAAVSKEEYLKRYLSGPGNDGKDKKKKKKPRNKTSTQSRVKIFDDDIGLDKLLPTEDNLAEEIGEEAPQIAAVIDDRPEHVKAAERSAKWKGLEADQKEKNNEDRPQSTRRRYDSDSDNSPVREQKPQRKRHDSSDSNQSEKKRQSSLSTEKSKRQSPPSDKRRQRHDSESDQSPPRKRGHAPDSDQSPPRKRGRASDSDQSPPRKRGHASDSDQSPPRRRGHADSDQSPPRKKGHASDSDQSPPRRKGHAESDQSPPRRKGHAESDQSPPRRSHKREQSPSSNRNNSTDKKRSDGKREKKSRWSQWEDEEKKDSMDNKGRDKKTLSGAVAGLSTAQQMREETKRLRAKEDEEFSRIDASVLGKDAETVVRKTGRRKKKEEEEETPEEIARKAAQKEQYDKWGKGLRQREDEQKNVEEALHEISKPLARGKDDKDLDRHLREQDRDGDPMLVYMKKKKDKPKAEKGKIIVMPKYKGPPAPPNRYNIAPGYRWDGRDRSNGFEKKFFTAIASRQAREQEAYMWSVEDM